MTSTKDSLKTFASWAFGILMGFSGLALISSSILGGFAALLLAALVIPPVSKAIFSKFDIKFKAGLGILSFFIFASQIPQDIDTVEPLVTPESNQKIELQSEVLGTQVAPVFEEIIMNNETPDPKPAQAEESTPIQEPEPTPTPPSPAPEPVQIQNTGPGYSCNIPKTCSQMTSCEEAYFYLNVCGDSARDGDNDGIPCESICQ